MSIWGRLVALIAPRNPEAEDPDGERDRAIERREAEVDAAVTSARIARRQSAVQVDRMGRLLAQARVEAEALGAPPMRDKPLRSRPRPVSRRNLCAGSC